MGAEQYRDREGAAETRDGYPLAYLLTFRCYGTWLHGDARGSVDREHNTYGTPCLDPDPQLLKRRAAGLKGEAMTLEAAHRARPPAPRSVY